MLGILIIIILGIITFTIQELLGQMSNASVSPTNPIVEAATCKKWGQRRSLGNFCFLELMLMVIRS